ncbi:MAG: hypothetical protein AB7K63_19335, partial [Vicinamibacterales bacterium]
GSGRFLQIGNQPRDITVEHNTVIHTGNVITAYGKPIEGFVFRSNMLRHNTYGVTGDGQSPGNGTLQAYFPGARFEDNVLAGGRASSYPASNHFPTVAEFEASFTNIGEGDFTLVPGSSFRNSGGGSALGADVSALASARGLAAQGQTPDAPAPAPAQPSGAIGSIPIRRWP